MKKCKTKNNNNPKFYDILSIPSTPEDLFTLTNLIGIGGFGKVFKAIHNTSNQVYAIKIIDYTKGNNNDKSNISFNYKSIQQETSLMRLVNKSDYILKYYGSYFSRDSNTIWLILEYCAGGSAFDLMLSMGRTLSEVEVATIMEQVLKGLIYIHKLNLIHRDIKGANIMLSEDGYAKLGDFGIGIQMTDDEYRTSKKGSPHWMSPQVIMNKNYDMKTDIWSLGITCLELVEGEPPFADLNPDEVMLKIANNPPKSEDIIDPKEHTDEFIDFVNLCLEINPNKRPSADILIKHPFIVKLSKKEEFLKQLINEHIEEVEKFRLDKEEYLNSKENLENQSINDNINSEESVHIKNYSVGNEIQINKDKNNGGINLNEIEYNESNNDKYNKKIVSFYNNNENNEDISNEYNNNQSFYCINNDSLNNNRIKKISVLSQNNNLNISDSIINKNSEEKNDIYINNKNKKYLINSEEKIINNERIIDNKKNISSNKLINNNLNSNGGKMEVKEEDIKESSDEEQIRPIKKININSSFVNIKNENEKINIPRLNLTEILNEHKNISIKEENSEFNTHDSPTHESSFSLFKMHGKYFN